VSLEVTYMYLRKQPIYGKMRTLFQKAEESILFPPACLVAYLHKKSIAKYEVKEGTKLIVSLPICASAK